MRAGLLHLIWRATQSFGLFWCNAYFSVFSRKQLYKGPLRCACVPFLYCHSCPSAVFSCPIGAIQHYVSIHQFPFFVVGDLMVLGLLVGRMGCGWLCPVGLFQDLMYKIKSRKILIPAAFSITPVIIFLLLVLLLPFFTSEHWFSKLCPVGTFVAGIPWIVWNPVNPETGNPTVAAGAVGLLFVLKLAILGGFLYLIVMAKRPFCKFVCPVGLFFSFFNKISLLRLKVASDCNRCDRCQAVCPVGIKVYEDPNSPDCVRCLQCTSCGKVALIAAWPSSREYEGNSQRTAPDRPLAKDHEPFQEGFKT